MAILLAAIALIALLFFFMGRGREKAPASPLGQPNDSSKVPPFIVGEQYASQARFSGSGGGAVLKGKVIHRFNKTPMPGVYVQCLNGNGSVVLQTDSNGRFRFEGVPLNRESRVIAVRSLNGNMADQKSISVTSAGDSLPELVLELAEGYTVAGTVVNRRGNPIQGVKVTLHNLVNGSKNLDPEIAPILKEKYTVDTDAAGRFVFADLIPAHYYRDAEYLIQFDHADYDTAMKYVVPEKPYEEISVTLWDRSPWVKIKGKVLDFTGAPVEGARVRVTHFVPGKNRPTEGEAYVNWGATDRDGNFAVEMVKYYATTDVMICAKSNAVKTFRVEHVDSADRDLGTIRLERGSEVRGILARSDGTPLARVPVDLRVAWGAWTNFPEVAQRIVTDDNGRFTFDTIGREGKFSICLGLKPVHELSPGETEIAIKTDLDEDDLERLRSRSQDK